MAQGCLALNASYEPLTVMPLKRAVRLVLQQKAEVVEADEQKTIRSANGTMPRPTVIRLVKFVRVPHGMKKRVTNTFLFARDGYRCQYCGRHQRELGERDGLTRDHVHPRSKGGTDSWDNVVTACGRCNHKKGDKTCAEAGMTLRTTPTVPDLVWLKWSVRKLTPMQQKYITMFYGEDVVAALK